MQIKTPDDLLKITWQRIPVNIKVAFFSAFLIGLFTHLFMFTNTLPTHDEVKVMIGTLQWATAINGRWLSDVAMLITSIFSMPWVNGLMSIVFLSISTCLIISIIRVKGYVNIILISGVMVTMPVVAGIFAFMQVAAPYYLSLLLICLAAFVATRYKFGFIFATIPIVLSMAIYQAFYGVVVALLILVLILDVLRNEMSWQKILFKGVRFVGTLFAGMVMYLVSVRIFYPDGLSDYQGLDQMGQMSISDFPNRILTAYREIIKFFVVDSRNFHYSFMNIVFVLAFVACAILILLWIIRKQIHKEPIKLLLLGALLVLFPLGCNMIYLMGPTEVHDLMIYGTVLILVFLLVVADLYHKEKDDKGKDNVAAEESEASKKTPYGKIAGISTWIITLAMALTMYNYWIVSNQAYFKLNIAFQTTYAQSILLISHIQSVEGYTYDKDIVIVGSPRIPEGIPELRDITIHGALGPELFGSWTYPFFLRHYLNFTQNVEHLRVSDIRYGDHEFPDIVREMPIFPDAGSIAIIDGVIYVRFAYID